MISCFAQICTTIEQKQLTEYKIYISGLNIDSLTTSLGRKELDHNNLNSYRYDDEVKPTSSQSSLQQTGLKIKDLLLGESKMCKTYLKRAFKNRAEERNKGITQANS